MKKGMVFPKPKAVCPYCNAEFWGLTRFYAHLKTCKARKKWRDNRPPWETYLQGSHKT